MLAPAAVVAQAPDSALSLEAAFASARRTARAAASPASVLSGPATVDEKLAAIDALHSRIPTEPKPRKIAALDALAAAAADPAQPPAVRAKALTFLGYAMPQVDDAAARSRALRVLLAALPDPAYRVFALRGLGPAAHGLADADEGVYQGALLDLLDGPVAGEERTTALVALYAFVASRDDLIQRKPDLVAQLDARLLGPIEADPARFVLDPRSTPAARELAIACVWSSARHRQTLGDLAPAARAKAVLDRLAGLETDPGALAWIQTYRTAAPPSPATKDTLGPRPVGPEDP